MSDLFLHSTHSSFFFSDIFFNVLSVAKGNTTDNVVKRNRRNRNRIMVKHQSWKK